MRKLTAGKLIILSIWLISYFYTISLITLLELKFQSVFKSNLINEPMINCSFLTLRDTAYIYFTSYVCYLCWSLEVKGILSDLSCIFSVLVRFLWVPTILLSWYIPTSITEAKVHLDCISFTFYSKKEIKENKCFPCLIRKKGWRRSEHLLFNYFRLQTTPGSSMDEDHMQL